MQTLRSFNSPKKTFAVVASTIALIFTLFPTSAGAAETALNMGSAATYGVLASSTITNATASTVSGTAGGDVGVGGGTAPTGVITYSGSQVLGLASLTALTAAGSALADNHAGTAQGVQLGGLTLPAGAYTGGTFENNGILTLDGGGNSSAVFIFRSASTVVTGVNSSVALINGAQACNVFWQVGSSATLGVGSTMAGHVIAQASISTGASTIVNGQLIAVTAAVTLGGTTIINNSCTTPVTPVAPVATVAPTTITPVATAVAADPATLHVIKLVVNTHGRSSVASSFLILVKRGNVDVTGPQPGIGGAGRTYTLPAGTYSLSEIAADGYRGEWSGPITSGGSITLTSGENVTVTRTNYDMKASGFMPTPVSTPDPVVTKTPPPITKTTTGGKLPNTSTPWNNFLLLGGGLLVVGALGIKARKVLVK